MLDQRNSILHQNIVRRLSVRLPEQLFPVFLAVVILVDNCAPPRYHAERLELRLEICFTVLLLNHFAEVISMPVSGIFAFSALFGQFDHSVLQ